MGWHQRSGIYAEIEAHRNRPLIVYVTSKRAGIHSQMSNDALPFIIQQIEQLPEGAQDLDFLIASLGGDPMVAWRIMSLLRQRVKTVSVIVPQSAYSAATLVSFGANEIILHPNGHLGPVDMQITAYGDGGLPKMFSTEDISAFLDFVRDNLKITDQEHIRVLFEQTCKEVSSLGIGFTARSSRLAVDLGERLLALHMKDDDSRSKLRTIVENMSRKFQSHSYPVNRSEALEIGLPVNKERDIPLEKLIWKAWLDIEGELKELSPFHPQFEVMQDPDASAKLLSPVAQVNIPSCAVAGANYQTSVADIKAAAEQVPPVDYETKLALVESARLAHVCATRGKILACRNPDMVINYSTVATFRGWEKQQQPPEIQQIGAHA
jgi:hypothetical protein